jgi:hypothetical protein
MIFTEKSENQVIHLYPHHSIEITGMFFCHLHCLKSMPLASTANLKLHLPQCNSADPYRWDQWGQCPGSPLELWPSSMGCLHLERCLSQGGVVGIETLCFVQQTNGLVTEAICSKKEKRVSADWDKHWLKIQECQNISINI